MQNSSKISPRSIHSSSNTPTTIPSSGLSAIASSNFSATIVTAPLTAALIKEYLSSRGLTKTLDAFKLEFLQFQKTAISSRQELAEQLGISKLIRQNKAQGINYILYFCVIFSESSLFKDQPLKSQLEIIVKHLVNRASQTVSSQNKTSPPALRTPKYLDNLQESFDVNSGAVMFKRPLGGFTPSNPRAISAQPNKASERTNHSTSSRKLDASFSSHLSEEKGTTASSKLTRSNESSQKEHEYIDKVGGEFVHSLKGRPKSAVSVSEELSSKGKTGGLSHQQPKTNDIQVLDEFDEDDLSFTSDIGAPVFQGGKVGGLGSTETRGVLISTQKALLLRKVVFPGTISGGEESRARSTFADEWRGKGFCFNDNSDLAYGIVQIKGGPCGLLAAVQAFVLKHLLFVESVHNIRNGKLRPGTSQTQTALIESFAEILWQAGGTRHRRAVVAVYNPNLRANLSANLQREKYVPDGITENMQLFEFYDINLLKEFLLINIGTFTVNDPNKQGLIQLLYSVILSRGAETLRDEDFDEIDCSLIGRHGYCTQEMVNLILTGKAISNVHDGDIRLGDGEDTKILKGMKKTCQFGFLSLFEHYGSMKVGEYLKTPLLPIFIICSESHFTVLFSVEKDLLGKHSHTTALELFYYDGLANQDEEIVLEIALDSKKDSSHEHRNESLIPPLEHVLKTRLLPGCVDSMDIANLLSDGEETMSVRAPHDAHFSIVTSVSPKREPSRSVATISPEPQTAVTHLFEDGQVADAAAASIGALSNTITSSNSVINSALATVKSVDTISNAVDTILVTINRVQPPTAQQQQRQLQQQSQSQSESQQEPQPPHTIISLSSNPPAFGKSLPGDIPNTPSPNTLTAKPPLAPAPNRPFSLTQELLKPHGLPSKPLIGSQENLQRLSEASQQNSVQIGQNGNTQRFPQRNRQPQTHAMRSNTFGFKLPVKRSADNGAIFSREIKVKLVGDLKLDPKRDGVLSSAAISRNESSVDSGGASSVVTAMPISIPDPSKPRPLLFTSSHQPTETWKFKLNLPQNDGSLPIEKTEAQFVHFTAVQMIRRNSYPPILLESEYTLKSLLPRSFFNMLQTNGVPHNFVFSFSNSEHGFFKEMAGLRKTAYINMKEATSNEVWELHLKTSRERTNVFGYLVRAADVRNFIQQRLTMLTTSRKLPLVLDLDDTLVRMVGSDERGNVPPNQAELVPDRVRTLTDGRRVVLTDRVEEFLQWAQRFFEINVCSVGDQPYVDMVVGALDPQRNLIRGQLYSARAEFIHIQGTSMARRPPKDLESLFVFPKRGGEGATLFWGPFADPLVVDDNVGMWPLEQQDNIIVVREQRNSLVWSVQLFPHVQTVLQHVHTEFFKQLDAWDKNLASPMNLGPSSCQIYKEFLRTEFSRKIGDSLTSVPVTGGQKRFDVFSAAVVNGVFGGDVSLSNIIRTGVGYSSEGTGVGTISDIGTGVSSDFDTSFVGGISTQLLQSAGVKSSLVSGNIITPLLGTVALPDD
ncbi:hypothetical protein HK100_000687 [Physocladia obscura]|uniref:Probable ubiquitin carboxyl-terminal hydrolase MINDY-4 n=1 Tax=Physocladia obscura TaxID=109957 RepID=A0AAD5XHH6_9FUNG|nr:hypothetical protein HK100_000687 [Physocladia obscura]